MARINYLEQILSRIESMTKGEVFIISDFSDLADEATVRKALSRLEEDGKIRRIMRGVYENPKFNDFLGEYVKPHPDKIAKALARNYGWTIVPCSGFPHKVPPYGFMSAMEITANISAEISLYSLREQRTRKFQKFPLRQPLLFKQLKHWAKIKLPAT